MAERKPYFLLKLTDDPKRPYMFNLHAGNGEVIATSQRYRSKDGALVGIESVRQSAPNAEFKDKTEE